MAESDLPLVEAQFRHPYCEECGLLKDDCECEEDDRKCVECGRTFSSRYPGHIICSIQCLGKWVK